MIRRIVVMATILLFLLSLLPTGLQTFMLARSAQGLTIIALLEPSEWTFNPYSANGIFLPPRFARWLLLNFDFPYRSCDQELFLCDISLVSWVGRSLTPASSEKREHAIELLRHFIARGESVSQVSQGVTPLHEAVLYGDLQYLDLLLDAGADVRARANNSSRLASGLTPLEFCLKLLKKRGGSSSPLCERLRSAQSLSIHAPDTLVKRDGASSYPRSHFPQR